MTIILELYLIARTLPKIQRTIFFFFFLFFFLFGFKSISYVFLCEDA